ncbi:MAG TPA: CPBP family intramembrane glutamic endopeptidase [Gemmatimonadales bacterium]|nr:CPBP family intramembrane glutamic endopeptidase [Gemmatimonadales bacterium]
MINTYWQASRAPRYSLLLALPLLILYQVLAALAPAGPDGMGIRNGADVALQSAFVWLAGAWGPRLFLLCLIAVGAWLIARDVRRNHASIRPALLAGMLLEAICLALVFGIVVGGLTTALLGGPPPAMAVGAGGTGGYTLQHISRATLLMISLGAGIYEELLFRVLLVGLLAWGANKLLGWRPLIAGIAATVLGALIFSAFHYIGPFGDRWDIYSFVFRTIAGLFFSGLYLLRGFGITAWTHALYDVLLLLR